MKKTVITLTLMFAVGLSTGCDKGIDEVSSDGTKVFGKRTLKDGTIKEKRVEFPDGQKDFGETVHPDGTRELDRVERADGLKFFDEMVLKDGTRKVGRMEWPNNEKWFDVTLLPDGTKKITRAEMSNGEKDFGVTVNDGSSEIKRIKYPDGRELNDVTQYEDGSVVEHKNRSTAPEPVFGNEQNDTIGFDQIPWSTPEYNGDDIDKRFHFENGDCDSYEKDLARVVGPPVNWPSAKDLGFADAVSASGVGQQYVFYKPRLPQGVSVRMKDERVCYGFFDGKFAFAFSYVGQGAYAATKEKYALLKTVDAESWGDPLTRSLPPHLVRYTANETAYLFRRGDTNTRIYVFGESLMYIPQAYLLPIRERWDGEYKKAKAEAAEQQRQVEEQRRQATEKAVQ